MDWVESNPIGFSKYITGPETIYTERVDLDVLKPSKLDCRGRVIGTWSQVGVCLAILCKKEFHLVQRGPRWGRGRENSMYFSAVLGYLYLLHLQRFIFSIFQGTKLRLMIVTLCTSTRIAGVRWSWYLNPGPLHAHVQTLSVKNGHWRFSSHIKSKRMVPWPELCWDISERTSGVRRTSVKIG